MKKKNKIEKMNRREWAEEAARLSGERSGSATNDDRSAMEKDLQIQWNNIKMAYKEKDIDTDKAWLDVSNRIAASEEKKNIVIKAVFPLFPKIAASIIIVGGLGWGGLRLAIPKQILITSAANEKNITVTLPDGSIIWLNRNSSLTYPARFNSQNRTVKLDGEAFFDVARDESKPFVIDAGKAEVKVLGTSFNVMTDNGNSEVEVFVTTGSVLVSEKEGERSVTLKPGFIGRVSDKTNISELNTDENYLSWNTEKLIYNGQDLGTVFSDLKRAYNIDIRTADTSIQKLTLTSVFEEQPHDTIIKVICTTFNLRYIKNDEGYLLLRK